MVRFYHILLSMILFAGWTVSAQGQEVRARVEGLGQDSVYMELLKEEQGLRTREDSLLSVIRRERETFNTDTTNLFNRSQAILRLEETVFDLRNQLGVVASKINGIEQEFILKNLFNPNTSSSPARTETTNERNLVDNAYFRENLTAGEYRQLKEGKSGQPETERLIADYRELYAALEEITRAYDEALTQSAADSVYTLYRGVLSRIRQAESEFRGLWNERYNQEIYLYSYLLDKLNRMDALAALNEQARARQVFDGDKVMSVVFAAYPEQRSLLVGYELALADALKLSAAADSLRRVERTIGGEELAFPKIELAEKEFVHYENVSFPEVSPYNAENPIPELWIPESGTYYSVTVGTFSQRQAVSVFRGATPIAYQRTGSQWRYFAGLFRSYGDAAEAVQQLKNAGFRRPEAVRWRDLHYENLAAEAAKNEGLFRIEIGGTDGELPEEVREALARYARTKEITRVGETFYVGTFTDKLHVDDVAQALEKVGGLDFAVEELEE